MRLIFSDVDGTLLNDQHQVTMATRNALQDRIRLGDIFIPVSARMPEAIVTAVNTITKNCPMICYNGAFVLDKDGKIISSHTMSIKAATEIISFVEKNYTDVAWNAYAGHKWLSPKLPANINEEKIVKVSSTKATIQDVSQLKNCHKVLLIGTPKQINELQIVLKKRFKTLSIVKSSPILLEINAKGIQKGRAVGEMIKYFNVPIENTLAFGDNFNDEEMLKTVGHSVAMGNAPQKLKKEVEKVTLDNNNDGIARVLLNL